MRRAVYNQERMLTSEEGDDRKFRVRFFELTFNYARYHSHHRAGQPPGRRLKMFRCHVSHPRLASGGGTDSGSGESCRHRTGRVGSGLVIVAWYRRPPGLAGPGRHQPSIARAVSRLSLT